MRNLILLALGFAIACVVAGVIIVSRPLTPDTTLPTATAVREMEPSPTAHAGAVTAPPTEAPSSAAPVAALAPISLAAQTLSPPEPTKAATKAPSRPAPGGQGGGSAKKPLHDPLAREALAFVGADPFAEGYWYAAINDPSLPANERQDLIEDLNEDGLSDPKHPGPEDLPLILNRLALIEQVAPAAPDHVNAEALAEAYKDLQQLARMVIGSGEVVK